MDNKSPVDGQGRTFDPELHLVRNSGPLKGQPVIHHLTGRLILKATRVPRPAAAAAPTPPPAPAAVLPAAETGGIIEELFNEAPRQQDAAPEVKADATPHLKDRHDNPFDKNIHVTNEDGTPKLSPTGRLVTKPGFRTPRAVDKGRVDPPRTPTLDLAAAAKPGVADALPVGGDADPSAAVHASPQPVLTEEQQKKLAKDTAEMTVQLVQAVGRFFGGKEGTFKNDEEHGDEKKELKDSLVAWYETMENLVHVSPGWLAAVNMGKYMGRVAETETAQRRIEKGTSWITSFGSKVRLAWHTWRATENAKKGRG